MYRIIFHVSPTKGSLTDSIPTAHDVISVVSLNLSTLYYAQGKNISLGNIYSAGNAYFFYFDCICLLSATQGPVDKHTHKTGVTFTRESITKLLG